MSSLVSADGFPLHFTPALNPAQAMALGMADLLTHTLEPHMLLNNNGCQCGPSAPGLVRVEAIDPLYHPATLKTMGTLPLGTFTQSK